MTQPRDGETVILQFGARDERKSTLESISINDTHWPTSIFDPIILLAGQELVIRQEGHQVHLIRRAVSRGAK